MLKKIFPILLIILLVILGLSGEGACYRRQKEVRTPCKPMSKPSVCPVGPDCSQPCLIPSPEVLPPHQGPSPVLTVPPPYENKCRETQPDLSPDAQPKPCEASAVPEAPSEKPARRKLRKIGALPPPASVAPTEASSSASSSSSSSSSSSWEIEFGSRSSKAQESEFRDHASDVLTASTRDIPDSSSGGEHNEVLLWMVRSGHLKGVQSLNRSGISYKDRSEAFLAAAECGKEEIVKELCEGIEPDVYLEALETAVEHGQLKSVQMLLHMADFYISDSARGEAIVKAAASGRHRHQEKARDAIVFELLRFHSKISESHRGKAIIYAAQNDYPNIVRALLKDGSISSADYIEALEIATKCNNSKVVDELLKFQN